MQRILTTLLLTAMTALYITGCTPTSDGPKQGKTFVLIHGAWQAPYVWNTVKSQLEKSGQKVITVELPAHGNDSTSPAAVSIDIYRDKIIDAIKDIHEKIILVGHSMGGVAVSAVAEKIPERIEKIVYIGAFVPANGQSLLDLALKDNQSLLGPNLVPSKDQLTLDIIHDKIISIFCQDASPTAQQAMLVNYRAEPAIPFTNALTLTDKNFGNVDKYYIHTLMDQAIGKDLQDQMVAAAHIKKLFSINSGHSPFLSRPDEVTQILLQIAFQ